MAVPGTETAVLVLCSGGAPSASSSAGLTRARSVADCVVSLDVVSWLCAAAAVVVMSGSSGRLERIFGIGPIKMGSRSLRTLRGLPRVTGVGLHGSQTMSFTRASFHSKLKCTASNY